MEPLFSNDYFHLFCKPAGVNFHSEDGEAGFVVHCCDAVGEQLYPVHRLDKVTSGLQLLARTSEAAHELAVLFEKREVEKYYLALSTHKPKKKQGAVVGDMSRSRRSSWKLERTMNNPARTSFFSYGSDGARLFVVRPRTGKTHQIRVALKSLGSPVLGDPLYSPAAEPADRTYLHAAALRFELHGEPFSFVHLPENGELWQSLDQWPVDTATLWDLPWPKK